MKLYKKSFKGIALAAFSVLALSACSDWTDSESIKLKEPGIDEQSPELYAKYLKNLREYKNSDHKIVYGWFDNSEKVPFSRGQHMSNSNWKILQMYMRRERKYSIPSAMTIS